VALLSYCLPLVVSASGTESGNYGWGGDDAVLVFGQHLGRGDDPRGPCPPIHRLPHGPAVPGDEDHELADLLLRGVEGIDEYDGGSH
jgi:hypothetical protein